MPPPQQEARRDSAYVQGYGGEFPLPAPQMLQVLSSFEGTERQG